MANDPGTGDRAGKPTKAGKKHGSVTYPPPAKPENLAAREQGEKQFVAKQQLTVQKEVVKYDEKTMRFTTRVVAIPVDYQFDPTRGRMVTSPVVFREKKGKGGR